jgi:hypothetical protein
VRIAPRRTGFAPLLRSAPLARRDELPPRRTALHELAEEQLALTMAVLSAGGLVEDVPRDPSAHAAANAMRARLAELAELRNALNAVHLDSADARLAPLFGDGAPLTEYMRGLYAWTRGVLRALDEVGQGLRILSPDWALLRARLEHAAGFYLPEIEPQIGRAATYLKLRSPELDAPCDPVSDFDERLLSLFAAAARLARGLDQRFG